jgi:hypothetical protein
MKDCTNCGSNDLRWHVGKHVGNNGVQDGRLKLNEVQVIAFLACEDCSETLQTIGDSEIEGMLNWECK